MELGGAEEKCRNLVIKGHKKVEKGSLEELVVSRKEKRGNGGEKKRKRLNCKRGTRKGAKVKVNS